MSLKSDMVRQLAIIFAVLISCSNGCSNSSDEAGNTMGLRTETSTCETWAEIKAQLRRNSPEARFVNTYIYSDEYSAEFRGRGSRGWSQWVVVLTPCEHPPDSEQLLNVIPELTRPSSELQLPFGASRETDVPLITRRLSVAHDEDWAAYNEICLSCLGPNVILDDFRSAIVIVDSRVLSNDGWFAAGNELTKYVRDFDFNKDVRGRLNSDQIFVVDLDNEE